MRKEDIKVGKTYKNRGAGKTVRKVLGIGREHLPKVAFNATGKFKEGEIGVLYEQDKYVHTISLTSFSSWAGEEAKNNESAGKG